MVPLHENIYPLRSMVNVCTRRKQFLARGRVSGPPPPPPRSTLGSLQQEYTVEFLLSLVLGNGTRGFPKR